MTNTFNKTLNFMMHCCFGRLAIGHLTDLAFGQRIINESVILLTKRSFTKYTTLKNGTSVKGEERKVENELKFGSSMSCFLCFFLWQTLNS
jgi:hypothetical protein